MNISSLQKSIEIKEKINSLKKSCGRQNTFDPSDEDLANEITWSSDEADQTDKERKKSEELYVDAESGSPILRKRKHVKRSPKSPNIIEPSSPIFKSQSAKRMKTAHLALKRIPSLTLSLDSKIENVESPAQSQKENDPPKQQIIIVPERIQDLPLEPDAVYHYIPNNSTESPQKKRRKPPVGSLLDRFRKLVKKQEAHLSMWRHEHYMAAHTNFEIPAASSDQVLLLRIKHFQEEYGIFRIFCDDSSDKKWSIFMNHYFVKDITVRVGWKLRIYKPYECYQLVNPDGEEESILLNVCKYDTIKCQQ